MRTPFSIPGITALDGPFLRDVDLAAAGREVESSGSDRSTDPGPGVSNGLDGIEFGRHPGGQPLDEGSFLVHGPARIRVEVPRRIARAYNFVAEAELDSNWGQAGSVQVHAGLEVPQATQGLVPPVGANDAHPEANANPEPARFPVIVGNDFTQGRFRKAFAAFRKWFPPAMCYTQIVPVDEGITISLFHREDRALSRLVLEEEQKRELDRLWHELRYVSQDAFTIADSFDEWWNFGAHYKKFTPRIPGGADSPPGAAVSGRTAVLGVQAPGCLAAVCRARLAPSSGGPGGKRVP